MATKKEYWTGYREKFRDAPVARFGLSLQYSWSERIWPVVPVSAVSNSIHHVKVNENSC